MRTEKYNTMKEMANEYFVARYIRLLNKNSNLHLQNSMNDLLVRAFTGK